MAYHFELVSEALVPGREAHEGAAHRVGLRRVRAVLAIQPANTTNPMEKNTRTSTPNYAFERKFKNIEAQIPGNPAIKYEL